MIRFFHTKTKSYSDKMTCVEEKDVYEKKAGKVRDFGGDSNIDLLFWAFGKIVLAWLKH